LHFPSVLQAFDGQTEFSWASNFTILSYSQNLLKVHARENNMVYSNLSTKVSCEKNDFCHTVSVLLDNMHRNSIPS